jgi:hypothetical protein
VGFRKPLDLTDVLKQYEVFGGGNTTAGMPRIDPSKPWHEQAPGAFEEEARQRVLQEERANKPQKVGFGPAEASTCTALVPSPMLCWDVLGYYRAMGVHWKATRKELMRAYQAKNGQDSVILTYIFKQLLNDEVRREYDCTPLGQPFLNDKYVQEHIKKVAAKEAARRSKAGRPTTAQEVVEENYKFIPDPPEDGIDAIESSGADSLALDLPWPYAWYTWRSVKEDPKELAEWQSLIIRAVAEQGVTLNFAVGFLGKQPHRHLVGRIGKTQVAFLNEKECPTPALASAAALSLIKDSNPR